MKVLASIIFLIHFNLVFAQVQFEADTLTYNNRISGEIDTVDIANSTFSSVFDGGISFALPGFSASRQLMENIIGRQFQQQQQFGKLKFSGLPHLGFAYSFGAQGVQFIHATYQHALSDKMLLNVDFEKSNGNGFIRNSAYGLNDLKVQLQRSSHRYSFSLNSGFVKNSVTHPGGITSDTLIEDFGLEFSNVAKLDANSVYQSGKVQLTNYLNFLTDSSKQLGLISYHDYSIRNRVYLENDAVSTLYSVTNIDSNSTREQFNLPVVENGIGLYYSNPKLFLSGHMNHVYWNYQNLGEYRDTTELNLRSRIKYNNKEIGIANTLYYNLAGRFNEYSNYTAIHFSRGKFDAAVSSSIKSLAPDPMMRHYYGNHINYSENNIERQNVNRFEAQLKYNLVDSLLSLACFGDYTTINGAYIYADSVFRNDTLSDYQFVSVGAKFKLDVHPFHLMTTFKYNVDSDNFLPTSQLHTRAYLKGRLFEAKKLEVTFGLDFTFNSKYKVRTYVPMIDMYDYYNSGLVNSSYSNLHAFASLGIDEFKFYLRFENIGYFWSDKTIEVKTGYPISSPRFRVGLTWDFFN